MNAVVVTQVLMCSGLSVLSIDYLQRALVEPPYAVAVERQIRKIMEEN